MRALLAGLALLLALTGTARAEPLTMFGAASLTDALQEAGAAFEAETGIPVRFSFAASSTLARQVEAGAPADMVALASAEWMDWLAERGLVLADSLAAPIRTELVLVAPADSPAAPLDLAAGADLPALLGPDGRLAVGDPEHVPAGIYARAALEHLGLWPALEPRLARADNVRAALALVERGEAPLGIVYATDAAAVPGLKLLGRFPADSHPPIAYPFALVAPPDGAAPERMAAARRFLDFLTGDAGLALFERHGFSRN